MDKSDASRIQSSNVINPPSLKSLYPLFFPTRIANTYPNRPKAEATCPPKVSLHAHNPLETIIPIRGIRLDLRIIAMAVLVMLVMLVLAVLLLA
jgi:hypothetical protein